MSVARDEKGMVRVPGGSFRMGSTGFYPEEGPVREVVVDSFLLDRHPVTVSEFRRFVDDSGYVTVAERPLDPADYPDADPALLVPGSLVFHATPGPMPLNDASAWWRYVPGASWRRPEGPGSDVAGRARHPVTPIAFEDAQAFAAWAGKELPSEAEWEYAARGAIDGAVFASGDEMPLDGKPRANFWHGDFPWRNTGANGWRGTSAVGSCPPNGYGFYDMTGNVWEWTADFYSPRGAGVTSKPEERACCVPRNPRIDSSELSFDVYEAIAM